jgi:SAM-dependent methyltransferase
MPISFFFRGPHDFPEIEKTALDLCSGHVLDIGAGTGVHSLELQARGQEVTAVDICPEAIEIMDERGVIDARLTDIFGISGGSFDTLLILGHGIGISGDLSGLDHFLKHSRKLVRSGGCLLLDSMDVRKTDDQVHLAYHERNRRAGKYFGINRLQLEFAGRAGPYFDWLHVDPDTLCVYAESAGWGCEIVAGGEGGNFLAKLVDGKKSLKEES